MNKVSNGIGSGNAVYVTYMVLVIVVFSIQYLSLPKEEMISPVSIGLFVGLFKK